MKNCSIFCRFGGVGDSAILTVVAKALKARNIKVYFAVREGQKALFDNLDCFDEVWDNRRIMGVDCISQHKDQWISLDAIKKYFVPYVFDFKNSVENNSLYGFLADLMGPWIKSQNSNYQNWIDLSLAWANIDPKKIKDKKIAYKIKPEEKTWAEKTLTNSFLETSYPLIAIQPRASSLSRSWYATNQLMKQLFEKYPDGAILIFEDETKSWILHKQGHKKSIQLPEHQVRHSVALMQRTNCLISADTGLVHLCSSFDHPMIVFYTTVPAWTRCAYMPTVKSLEPNIDCFPCFNLGGYCPRREKEAKGQLSDRERLILKRAQEGKNPVGVAQELNTLPGAVVAELEALQKKLEALKAQRPYCEESISVNDIIREVDTILTEGRRSKWITK